MPRVSITAMMTLPRCLPIFALAALAVLAAPACKKQPPAAPPSAATPPQKSASVGGPSASTAKAADASDARIQPQPAPTPCVEMAGGRDPGLPDLLEQAGRDFEKGRYEGALECAREASRVDGTSVAAHHFRGAALAELGHIEEARTAYARALAIDPDDPEVLRSAADLHVRRLGARDDLELALQYVHRALPRATRGKDKGLLKELYLLQAMALDDLGRPADALVASTRALDYDGRDREARREKGVALFELCRFDQAKSELSRLANEVPDAWAEHYLGLIAERAGDDVAAAAHFARARNLDPDAFKPTAQAPRSVFQKIVQEELEKLPPAIKAGLARAHFEVKDLPEVSDLVATDPPLSPGILGLFRPPPESAATDARPTILLYRRNLSRAAHNDDELRREVRDTLMHEVGHLNGEDDEQLRDRGL
jgi:Flp pilus assembly protein TadD/predicted Zn-dependent protease with MMP-like domain